MNFIKKLTGKGSENASACCGVEIKEVETGERDSCCGTANEDSCC
ncbi:hypothetical protein [Bacillus sp. AK031]